VTDDSIDEVPVPSRDMARESVVLRSTDASLGIDTDLCPPEVFTAELDEIHKRRSSARVADERPSVELAPGRVAAPSTQYGLVGLAISGGGIRSSTFSLGVVQALEQAGAFKYVDYLSTVSGGGYTGAMLSSALRAPNSNPEHAFPLKKELGEGESIALRHLRNGSNYLSSSSTLSKLRLPMLLVRGVLLNVLALLPSMMLLVFATEVAYEKQLLPDIAELGEQGLSFKGTPILWGLIPFAVFLLAFPALGRTVQARLTWRGRNRLELAMAAAMGLSLFVALLIPAVFLVEAAIETSWETLAAKYRDLGSWHLTVEGSVLAFFAANTGALVGAVRDVTRKAARWFFYCLGVLGPLTLFGLYLLLCVAQIDSPFISKDFEKCFEGAPVPDSGTLGDPGWQCDEHLRTELFAALHNKGIAIDEDNIRVRQCQSGDRGAGRWLLDPGHSTVDWNAKSCNWGSHQLEEGRIVLIVPRGDDLELQGAKLRVFGEPSDTVLFSDAEFFGGGLLLFIYMLFFLDVNRTSLHVFYRDRLSRLYLFRVNSKGDILANDKLKLSELRQRGSVAPYHLINAALNLQSNETWQQRGRQAGFFVFSKHYSGSEHTGYCHTEALEKADPHLDLGTAMAISGAAAAPNMGRMTNKTLTFIMTLLNIRLNYWLPNPKYVLEHRSYTWRCPGLAWLLRESMSRVDERNAYVNLSDGGHLENLGVYELLRRRCKLIIAVDGEQDGAYRYAGLMTLQRFAKIDLGIDIVVDLECLRPVDGKAKAHATCGRIIYSDDGAGNVEYGTLVYVKSSWTGDEEPYVAEYRFGHPDFPHESTADQYFDEEQFEAYRALGHHIGMPVAHAITSAMRRRQEIALGPVLPSEALDSNQASVSGARAAAAG